MRKKLNGLFDTSSQDAFDFAASSDYFDFSVLSSELPSRDSAASIKHDTPTGNAISASRDYVPGSALVFTTSAFAAETLRADPGSS